MNFFIGTRRRVHLVYVVSLNELFFAMCSKKRGHVRPLALVTPLVIPKDFAYLS